MGGRHRKPQRHTRAIRNITVFSALAGSMGTPAMAAPLHTPPITEAPIAVPKLNVYPEGVEAGVTKTSGKLQSITFKSQQTIPIVTVEAEKVGVTAAPLSAFQNSVMAMQPLVVKPAQGAFTSGFGMRWGSMHNGIDIANAVGTPIYAVMAGTVIDSGPASGYGNWIRIRHEDGAVSTYGHMETLQVSVGDVVAAGDQIATMGNRGFSTGPHLHFEIAPDGSTPVDPAAWLRARGISL